MVTLLFSQFSSLLFSSLLFPVLFWKVLPSCVASRFSVPPSKCFSVPPLTCPFPASLHLYLIPSLVCLCISLCFPSCLCQFVPCSPVMPHCVPDQCLLLCLPCWYVSFLFLEFSLICSLLLFAHCISSFVLLTWFMLLWSPWFLYNSAFVLMKLAFCSPILPPVCCLHLASQFVSTEIVTHLIKHKYVWKYACTQDTEKKW